MPNLLTTTFKIRAANGANGFIYFLRRLPLVGKFIPESLYAIGALKTGITLAVNIFMQVVYLFTKLLYLLGMVLLPAELLQTGDINFNWGNLLPAYVHILFWLSCFIPMFTDCRALKATKEKYICIKLMRAPPKAYLLFTLPFDLGLFFVLFLPALLLTTALAGGSLRQGFGLWFVLLAFRILGEAFQLWWFKKRGAAFFRKGKWAFATIGLGLAAAYLPIALGWPLPALSILLSIPGLLVSGGVFALSTWYVFWGYGYWQQAIPRNVRAEYVQPQAAATRQAAFADVQMREEDLSSTPQQSRRIQRKTGYAYFNALFFTRHRRQLWRPVLIRLAIVGTVALAGVLALQLLPSSFGGFIGTIPSFLPAFVFIMYAASIGQKACRAMFFNCDISLLRYAFYREPRVILRNFNIRLRYVAGYNLCIAGAICVASILLTALAGQAVFTPQIAIFCVSVLLLSIFFSVHHLFLYYVFQPYTTELDIKNPFYRLINTAIYLLCFTCLQIQTAGIWFAVGVLGFTLLYIGVALLLVRLFSPKYFRVK